MSFGQTAQSCSEWHELAAFDLAGGTKRHKRLHSNSGNDEDIIGVPGRARKTFILTSSRKHAAYSYFDRVSVGDVPADEK